MIFKAKAGNQLRKTIKILRSNRGREYISNSMSLFCEQNEFIHGLTAPYTPESNGVA